MNQTPEQIEYLRRCRHLNQMKRQGTISEQDAKRMAVAFREELIVPVTNNSL